MRSAKEREGSAWRRQGGQVPGSLHEQEHACHKAPLRMRIHALLGSGSKAKCRNATACTPAQSAYCWV